MGRCEWGCTVEKKWKTLRIFFHLRMSDRNMVIMNIHVCIYLLSNTNMKNVHVSHYILHVDSKLIDQNVMTLNHFLFIISFLTSYFYSTPRQFTSSSSIFILFLKNNLKKSCEIKSESRCFMFVLWYRNIIKRDPQWVH